MTANPVSLGKIDVEVTASMVPPEGVPEPEVPFRILLLGDFRGRVKRGVCEPGVI